MKRKEVIALLNRIADEVAEDRVTQDDDEAIQACEKLISYMRDHVTDDDDF